MKFIDILTDFNHGGLQYYISERCKVTDAEAGLFCGAGWAKDGSGELATGEPNLGETKLDIQDISHKSFSPTVGAQGNG